MQPDRAGSRLPAAACSPRPPRLLMTVGQCVRTDPAGVGGGPDTEASSRGHFPGLRLHSPVRTWCVFPRLGFISPAPCLAVPDSESGHLARQGAAARVGSRRSRAVPCLTVLPAGASPARHDNQACGPRRCTLHTHVAPPPRAPAHGGWQAARVSSPWFPARFRSPDRAALALCLAPCHSPADGPRARRQPRAGLAKPPLSSVVITRLPHT